MTHILKILSKYPAPLLLGAEIINPLGLHIRSHYSLLLNDSAKPLGWHLHFTYQQLMNWHHRLA